MRYFQVKNIDSYEHEGEIETVFFTSLDENATVEKAKEIFEKDAFEKAESNDGRIDVLFFEDTLRCFHELKNFYKNSSHHNDFAVFSEELDVEFSSFSGNTSHTFRVWEPTIPFVKEIFIKVIQKLMFADIQASISDYEANGLWELFLKDKEQFRQDNMYRVTKNGAELLELVSKDKYDNLVHKFNR